ncbi:hypothetical protein EJ02DRAFT_335274 [Clathrospora elynae]|uniref:Uncharacterized protein n=1 Tax=Clathrospora elynae TaxID=706981 RepID=A0A6A5T4W4_9PLEO|nr:hypothetical protein EJ02DRAFT_335274 [Clathrospora elynae]
MFDTLLGVSKQTFIENKVFPANDDDKFNDNKCTFCWGPYDQDHPERFLDDSLERLIQIIVVAVHKFSAIWRILPPWMSFPIRFWWHMNNVYYYAELLLHSCTNVHARNPNFDMDAAVTMSLLFSHLLSKLEISWFLIRAVSKVAWPDYEPIYAPNMLDSVGVVIGLSCGGAHGKFSNWGDRVMFFFVVIAALLLKTFAVTFFLSSNFSIATAGQSRFCFLCY